MLCSQKLFDAPTDKNWDIRFDFGNPIELGVLDFVYLVHGFDGHICFACQSFDVRFPVCKVLRIYRLVAHFEDSVVTERRILPRMGIQVLAM